MRPPLPICLATLMISACHPGGSASVDNNEEGDCVEIFGETCESTSTGNPPTGPGNTQTGGTEGTVVGQEDPGSGPGAGLWWIEARAEGARVGGPGDYRFESDYRVDIEDDQGQPASGLQVVMHTLLLDTVTLSEDPGNAGRYEGTIAGYARTYTLEIEPDDPQTRFSTTAVGPGVHHIAVPGQPLDITTNQTFTWTPAGASFAEIDTRGGGGQGIPDSGTYTVGVDILDYELGETDEERVQLKRWEVLDVENAVNGSTFEVSIEVEEDDIDTTDPRRSDLDGGVVLDGDFQGETGDVYILLWPDSLDADTDPYWAWTVIADADFVDQGTYLFQDLAPGDWFAIAYLDADQSDSGLAQPAGPTQDDPFDERDFTIDPGQDRTVDFDLRDRW